MPGVDNPELAAASTTPGRRTVVSFDLPESALTEPAWGDARLADQIRKATVPGIGDSYGVQQLASGWWGLEPVNAEFFEQHEMMPERPLTGAMPGASLLTPSGVLKPSDFNTIPELALIPMHRRPDDIPGVLTGASPDLQTENDSFFHILRPSGVSWSSEVITALPAPPVPKSLRNLVSEEHIKLDRVAEGVTRFGADTGFLLRWIVMGNLATKVDWVMRFYFGGDLTGNGLGQFCLLLGGNGMAVLYERQDIYVTLPPRIAWGERDTWRYANPQQTVNVVHNVRIIPHAGKFIEFKSQLNDESRSLLGRFGATLFPQPHTPTAHLHTVSRENQAKRPKGQPCVSGAGHVHIDVRRDLHVRWQVSRLIYRTDPSLSGQIVDYAMNVPWGLQDSRLGDLGKLETTVLAVQTPDPLDSAVRLKLYDGETNAELTFGGAQYQLPGGKNAIVPLLELATQDQFHSPFVYGYAVSRPPVIQDIDPGAFSGGILQSVSITGPDNDPTHETARIVLQDTTGEMPRLAIRGGFSVEIRTEYEGDPTKSTVLFRGYARSPRRRPMWREGMTYPTRDWAEYEIDCIGQWRRLQASLETEITLYAFDPSTQDESEAHLFLPWKVTDVIRLELSKAGLEEDQLDIPDFPSRLWAVDHGSLDHWKPASGSTRLSYCQRIAFDYLGAYLLWDANAGTRGMWRLKFQPVAGTPLWNFVADTEGVVSGIRLPHVLNSYPDGVSPILRIEGQPTLLTWVDPPEGTSVLFSNTGELLPSKGTMLAARAWATNTRSVDCAMYGTHANPDDPDYYGGYFEPVLIRDPVLGDTQGGRDAAAFTAKRMYNFACRARPMASWTGHLVLVNDPADPQLLDGKKRPLRYGDTVTITDLNGQADLYLIRSVQIECEHGSGGDRAQLASYQAQKWIAPD